MSDATGKRTVYTPHFEGFYKSELPPAQGTCDPLMAHARLNERRHYEMRTLFFNDRPMRYPETY